MSHYTFLHIRTIYQSPLIYYIWLLQQSLRNRAMFCITLSDVGGGFVGLYVGIYLLAAKRCWFDTWYVNRDLASFVMAYLTCSIHPTWYNLTFNLTLLWFDWLFTEWQVMRPIGDYPWYYLTMCLQVCWRDNVLSVAHVVVVLYLRHDLTSPSHQHHTFHCSRYTAQVSTVSTEIRDSSCGKRFYTSINHYITVQNDRKFLPNRAYSSQC